MNGERLKVAREASWLTQKELSDLSGIPASTISKIEKGLYGNNADRFVERLSFALDIPASFLLGGPLPDIPDGRFRRQSKASAKLKKSVIAHTRQAAEVMCVADSTYPIRAATITPLESGALQDTPETYACDLRDMIGVSQEGPVHNMTRACERAGVAIVSLPIFEYTNESQRHFSGFSTWPGMAADKARPIIVLSSSLPGDVQRATIAHELAHLYAHTRNPSVDEGSAEIQAWDIGRNILVPPNEIRAKLDNQTVTLEKLKRLKIVYGVSIKLLIKHCHSLGIIDDSKATSLNKQYTSRKWNKEEPVVVTQETALLYPSVLSRMRGDGIDVGMRQLEAARIIACLDATKRRREGSAEVLMLRKRGSTTNTTGR